MNRKPPIKTWSTPAAVEDRRAIPCALCGGNDFRQHLSCEGFAYVKCATCSLVQINPQPLAEQVQQRYRDHHGKDYFSYELENEAAFFDLQKRALADVGFYDLEKSLKAKAGSPPSAIDVGCATGALLAFLQERGWDVAGVEISPSAEYAQARLGIPISRSNLEDSHLPAESFDLVFVSHLLEHLNNPRAFLHETWRILRPGACLLLTTPNIDGFQARLFGSRWRSAIFDHLYLFSLRTLKQLLEKAGFVTEKVCSWGGFAAGSVPLPLKRFADKTAKALGFGDVMMLRARKR